MSSILDSAAHWDALALEAEDLGSCGITHPEVAANKAALYRRAALSLRMEAETGVAVCVCCLKPFGAGAKIPGVR